MHQYSVYISIHKETLSHVASPGVLPTWQGFGYEDPRQQYFHHCSMRSRPWRLGWSPAHSRLGQKRWVQLWYGESERLNPIWSKCWLLLQQSEYGHPEAAYRNGYSYPCSKEREKRGTHVERWTFLKCCIKRGFWKNVTKAITFFLYFTRMCTNIPL